MIGFSDSKSKLPRRVGPMPLFHNDRIISYVTRTAVLILGYVNLLEESFPVLPIYDTSDILVINAQVGQLSNRCWQDRV